ncbi:hypothetical protein [Blastococcus brunescens]|uniref:Uncharacterized protein n=1 Tax=Blastococcus brunescens TaxID=1564165 RepID=A0ABZ1B2I9_9ACTN|nr:hypothetical protein [Blastococcus sp. BMG 8361]WRL65015.1 hypothetical protein U6N30_04705 [Blastococcus sp. BMG 8361]
MAEPPADHPPPPGGPSDVDALIAAGPPGPGNPVTVGAVFWTAVTEPDGPDVDVLGIVVTPESWPHWRGFGRAATLLPGCAMASAVTPSDSDPDVAYLTFARDEHPTEEVDLLVATLVRRPRLGGWRVHALGQPVRPDHVPHDPRADPPRCTPSGPERHHPLTPGHVVRDRFARAGDADWGRACPAPTLRP